MEPSEKTISVWMKYRDAEVEPLRVILWRIKNISRMGEDAAGHQDGRGGCHQMKWTDALYKFKPAILEILFDDNPFESLKEAINSEMVCFFFASGSVHFPLLSHLSSLTAFSYSTTNFSNGIEYSELIDELSRLEIRAVNITGSCSEAEINGMIRKLGVELIRFCGPPGVSVELLAKTTAISSTTRFVVAQATNLETENDGLKFLKCLEMLFPCMKCLYWDWNMIDPYVTFDGQTKTCIECLVNLYRFDLTELNMKMLALAFYVPSSKTRAAVQSIWQYFQSFSLQNATMRKVRTKGLQDNCEPNFVFLMAGAPGELQRLEEIVYVHRITSPDLRHFLYVLDPSINIYRANATFEFMGFDV
ncbi:unnamed protein product [Gongylonema pulchrum]|uniref:FBD domain-containing protein n=1 Tax=Gongylonema pulchrum TaxID=637853 RepID=A0A183D0X8_9BILA|nr:unnamed protein product [Gongylonema pulchrum]